MHTKFFSSFFIILSFFLFSFISPQPAYAFRWDNPQCPTISVNGVPLKQGGDIYKVKLEDNVLDIKVGGPQLDGISPQDLFLHFDDPQNHTGQAFDIRWVPANSITTGVAQFRINYIPFMINGRVKTSSLSTKQKEALWETIEHSITLNQTGDNGSYYYDPLGFNLPSNGWKAVCEFDQAFKIIPLPPTSTPTPTIAPHALCKTPTFLNSSSPNPRYYRLGDKVQAKETLLYPLGFNNPGCDKGGGYNCRHNVRFNNFIVEIFSPSNTTTPIKSQCATISSTTYSTYEEVTVASPIFPAFIGEDGAWRIRFRPAVNCQTSSDLDNYACFNPYSNLSDFFFFYALSTPTPTALPTKTPGALTPTVPLTPTEAPTKVPEKYLPPCLLWANAQGRTHDTYREGDVCVKIDTGIGPLDVGDSDNTKGALATIQTLFRLLLGISGGVVIFIILSSGYRIMVSQGDPKKLEEARESLTAAIVGLFFIIFSLVILEIIGVNILHIPFLSQ